MSMDKYVTEGTGEPDRQKFSPGKHKVAIVGTGTRETEKHGVMHFVDFVVVDSDVHKPGYESSVPLFVNSGGLGQKYNRMELVAIGAAVLKSLGGNPDDDTLIPDKPGRTVGMQATSECLKKIFPDDENLGAKKMATSDKARGVMLDLTVKTRTWDKDDGTTGSAPKSFWKSVTQSKEDIAKTRKAIEAGTLGKAAEPEAKMLDGLDL